MSTNHTREGGEARPSRLLRTIVAVLWLGVIILCFFYRDKLTVDAITDQAPEGIIPDVIILLVLFSLKSVTVVLYSGIFFVAAGIMLPIYIAVPTVIAGIALMSTIPYMLGRLLRHDNTEYLLEKYPKLRYIRNIRADNDFVFSFLARVVSVIPNDPFSAYMGMAKANFPEYLLGSVLGQITMAIPLTIVGSTAGDWDSPAFLISVFIKIILVILSVIHLKRTGKNRAE